MTSGEVMAIATIIGSVFAFLGITGIDASIISQAITGIISLVMIGTSVWTYVAHKKAVAANTASAQQ